MGNVRKNSIDYSAEQQVPLSYKSGCKSILPLLAFFKLIPKSCFIINERGLLVDINEAFEVVWGYEQEKLQNANTHAWLPVAENKKLYGALGGMQEWNGEAQLRHKAGTSCTVGIRLIPVKDDTNTTRFVIGVLSDDDNDVLLKQSLEPWSGEDHYSNLISSRTFIERSTMQLVGILHARRKAAIVLINLDMFGCVNEALGHAVGDTVLTMVAQRLQTFLPPDTLSACLGGDEFAIFIKDVFSEKALKEKADELTKLLTKPYAVNKQDVYISVSIGISVCPNNGSHVSELIDHARTAMVLAKRSCGGTVSFYSNRLSQQAKERITLEGPLHNAIEEGQGLSLLYQPRVDVRTGKIVGVEALLRWRHEKFGFIAPERVIAVAECSGLIEPLGDWILGGACKHVADWLAEDISVGPVSVNLSVRQFYSRHLVTRIKQLLHQYDLPASLLNLEVTETFVVTDRDAVIESLSRLRTLGCPIIINNFGMGYSTLDCMTLDYLKRFPADMLKIDKHFIAGLPHNESDKALVRSIVALAHYLGLNVVAEGVETPTQYEFLVRAECDYAQGYWYAKPMSAEALRIWLQDYLSLPLRSRKSALVG